MKAPFSPSKVFILILLMLCTTFAFALDDKKKMSTATATYEMMELDLLQKQSEDISFELGKSLSKVVTEKLNKVSNENCKVEPIINSGMDSFIK
jgi:hypothetical protein